MRVLIAVASCARDRERGFHDALRDTWFNSLISITDKKFFYGSASTLPSKDEVELFLDDSYAALPFKTQAICGWALRNEFDYMFKCDNDTLASPWEFNTFEFSKHDYMGGENADTNVPGFPPGRIEFASGGAGYWLSRRAMQIVATAPTRGTAEDVFVAHALLQEGILPHFHPGYKWRPGSTLDKETVTLHLSSAYQKKYEVGQMHQAYRQLVNLEFNKIMNFMKVVDKSENP
jgi:hypothetical protein